MVFPDQEVIYIELYITFFDFDFSSGFSLSQNFPGTQKAVGLGGSLP